VHRAEQEQEVLLKQECPLQVGMAGQHQQEVRQERQGNLVIGARSPEVDSSESMGHCDNILNFARRHGRQLYCWGGNLAEMPSVVITASWDSASLTISQNACILVPIRMP
jgi:hypothetical protein